jgi:hypothetical protein
LDQLRCIFGENNVQVSAVGTAGNIREGKSSLAFSSHDPTGHFMVTRSRSLRTYVDCVGRHTVTKAFTLLLV